LNTFTTVKSSVASVALGLALAVTGFALPAQSAWAVTDSAHAPTVKRVAVRKAKPASRTRKAAAVVVIAAVPTFGQQYGLHAVDDPLDLKSGIALVMDQDTNEVLLSKNPQAVVPIASITKLMTALVVVEANQPLDEKLAITDDDKDTLKGTGSRLRPGTVLTRGELLHLALMSSENRAAHALGRNYPGGLEAAVAAMNLKAQALGMTDTHYVEPTGLSSSNQSSAKDLAALVRVAHEQPLLRDFTTSKEATVMVGRREMAFHSTNGLVRSGSWDIGLQKTGFINEAGKCLVMQAQMAGRKLIMVFLDATGKTARIADAERVRKWISTIPVAVAHEPKLE
jgi:D-alanyl-D-alanine endopeptidase (penicillin-binding protein 7)